MKTPIELMVDELFGLMQDHLETNKPAKDAMMGAITVASRYLEIEKSEIMNAWKQGYSYGSSGGSSMTPNQFYLIRYKPE